MATEATFQPPMGWLKAVAELKILLKSKHLATFQVAMSRLKPEAE